ncbi:MAG: DsbA family protein [Planctomycetota bacterium]|nr:DsbA family protein [Planctomycetota bacterium]
MTTKQETTSVNDSSSTSAPRWTGTQALPSWLGLLGLATAVFASLMLSLVALNLIKTLPGCGPESACGKVTSGIWGSIPGIGWPVSFIGFAYFTGLFVAWLRATPSRALLWIMRLGILGSIGFVVIMISEGSFCKWCVVSHIGNLVAWLSAEWLLRGRSAASDPTRSGLPALLASFCIVTVVLAVVLPIQNARKASQDAAGLARNQMEIASGTTDQEALARLEPRHVIGPRDAAVKVVLFTDYQCPDCKKTENLLKIIMKQRDDMSLGIKHYPYNTDCNVKARSTAHPNACWAARAAETAAILGGPEAFEKMHDWLFEMDGTFNTSQLNAELERLGFDRAQFTELMTSDTINEDIKSDTQDGYDLGLFYTPMMFINGVEFKWYYGGGDINSVRRTIEMAAQPNQAKAIPANRNQKLFEDWKNGRDRTTAGNALESWRGVGPVEVVVFADYQHDSAKQADQIMRNMLDKGLPIKYAWRHAPFEYRGDNPWSVTDSRNLALGVEAARELGGDEARWKAHDWVIANGGSLSTNDIAVGIGKATGLPGAKVFAMMASPKLKSKVARDEADKKRTWRNHSPAILVRGRHVPRWRDPNIDSQGFLEAVITSANEEIVPASGRDG